MTAEVINRSFCENCRAIVPVRHVERDNKVYLAKDCPNCGAVETLVSTDAARYYEKRRLCEFEGEARKTCSLKCMDCDHGFTPKLVLLDATNRCNMNCPICVANLGAMGFDFNPPIEYFDKIFKAMSKYDPKPRIQFFGGEPTVRNDLVDIIKLAKSYRLPARVVTNGIRLANEEYCKELLATGTHLLFAFDGRHPDIYKKMRGNPRALELKLKALDNVRKHRKSKITVLCTLGIGVNDAYIGDLLQFFHERRDYIAVLSYIPLQVTPGPVQIMEQSTTVEDVEQAVAKAMPGVEFVPAGFLQMFDTLKDVFNVRITLGGAHPNCESVTILVADEERYHPADDYLKKPFREAIQDALAWDRRMGEKLKTSWLAKLFGKRGKQARLAMSIPRLVLRNVRVGKVIGPRPFRLMWRLLWGTLVQGKQFKKLVRRYSGISGVLRMIVLPYEDIGWLESARLMTCPVAFAYEHPVARDVRLMPFCTWFYYKNEILRQTALNYEIQPPVEEPAPAAMAVGV